MRRSRAEVERKSKTDFPGKAVSPRIEARDVGSSLEALAASAVEWYADDGGADNGIFAEVQPLGIAGAGKLVGGLLVDERPCGSLLSTKPSIGNRPSWHFCSPTDARAIMAFFDMKTGLDFSNGLMISFAGFFFFLSPPATRL